MKFIDFLSSRKAWLTAIGAALITFCENMHWITHDQGQTIGAMIGALVLAIAHEDSGRAQSTPTGAALTATDTKPVASTVVTTTTTSSDVSKPTTIVVEATKTVATPEPTPAAKPDAKP